jgi:diguanylate cyclase (GGDEF)-like protein
MGRRTVSFMSLTEFLIRQNKGLLAVIGVFLLVAVGVGDFVIAPEFESSMFYVLPVTFFAWFVGRRSGLFTSAISAAATLGVHHIESPHYVHPTVIYWNAFAWLGMYLLLVLMIAELRTLYEQERHTARIDVLTRIPNRRAFFDLLTSEKSRARRYQLPLTLAYLDVDRFKEVNDRFGHTAGDNLLAMAAKTMRDSVRQADVVARIGGDEFAVLLPETPADSAASMLHKLHASLEDAMREGSWPVTFSVGAVSFHPPPDSIPEMIGMADEALYAAKTSGRNRVIVRKLAA